MTIAKTILTCLGVAFVLVCSEACENSTAPRTSVVQIRVDASLCGGASVTIRTSIDQVIVGTDTLNTGDLSKRYTTAPGQHAIGTVLLALGSHSINGGLEQDTTATIGAGNTFIYPITVSCS